MRRTGSEEIGCPPVVPNCRRVSLDCRCVDPQREAFHTAVPRIQPKIQNPISLVKSRAEALDIKTRR